jgi:hypothetical protein
MTFLRKHNSENALECSKLENHLIGQFRDKGCKKQACLGSKPQEKLILARIGQDSDRKTAVCPKRA